MYQSKGIGTALCSGVFALWINHAGAQEFTAHLTGFNEVGSIPTAFPPASSTATPTGYTGAVLSDGRATATLELDEKAGAIDYKLTYSNVGSTPPQTGTVSQAHIHFGKSRDSGGILVFFCTNLGNGPAGVTTPPCPANSGTVTGTWTKLNVIAIPGQNVDAQNFDALVEALEHNTAYANIHTVPLPGATNTAYPGGEIRGQVHRADRDETHHDHDNHQHN
jgi:hypothetical protein